MVMEFHVSRAARDRYRFDESLFFLTGNVILPNFAATRRFAQRMNESRDLARAPEQAVLAGQLNAMGLIDEILHHVVALYREQVDPAVIGRALAALDRRLGADAVDGVLAAFVEEFPTVAVYRREVSPASHLDAAADGIPNRQVALEELLLLWLANANPAFAPFGELFDDSNLERTTAYRRLITELEAFFATEPPFGPDRQPLVTMLRSPALAAPDSLPGQLRYIRERWGLLLERFLDRLVVSLDVLSEEERAHWLRFHAGAGDGRGAGEAPGLAGLEFEPERFSLDRDWMPRLVLMAKSAYVWLDQLSRRYGREIRTLDAIPDEELDTLARWGISGLWLIGLWERSRASALIKQLRGNPEAVASAYSLLDYRVADDLGGESAYANLRNRAWARGIRLASDMVPNHMGIDSRWVIEHPERFLSLPDSPFPSYSFTGIDLSGDEGVGIFLEDHYWDNSDAAVVFKRVDRRTGEERYIYHGNDGTSFPWNDTAQLDYLKAEVREAVIQTILHVARQFPVIRFDAAMTLAKRHIQRLWYPEPGSGGGIPSRAEHGLTKAAFDAAMPVEFWREVVDRVAAEAPDTLLLAEAFWMLEGYFVRTLGMHRVYNSAFMHMLRDEDNAGYRRVIKDTLEFDPEILKRYVNFMNNPDEKGAVEQFGKGDKYFGICTLLATLPGLPMLGHGQVEGFAEKYGMEYRRAYQDEAVDSWLVARHEREIFPLFHRRHLFAEVRDFLLYDVVAPDGSLNENVFAYSNRAGGERSLVVYHNRYANAQGWIRTSVPYAEKSGPEGAKTLRRRTLGEGLGLLDDPDRWLVCRDSISGLEYLRDCRTLVREGLYVELDAYRCHVFLGFRELVDGPAHQYRRLAKRLGGRGVPSIDEALRELQLEPVHRPFRRVLEADLLRRAVGGEPAALDEIEARHRDFVAAVAEATGTGADERLRTAIAQAARAELAAIGRLADLRSRLAGTRSRRGLAAADLVAAQLAGEPARSGILAAWALVRGLGRLADGSADTASVARTGRAWLDELRLGPVLAGAFRDLGLGEGGAWHAVELVRVLITLPRPARLRPLIETWLADEDVRPFIRVNHWEGVAWFNKEAFEQLTGWLLVLDAIEATADPGRPAADVARALAVSQALVVALRAAGEAAGYRLDRLASAITSSSARTTPPGGPARSSGPRARARRTAP